MLDQKPKKEVARILRSNGYRATPQRLAIYEALHKSGPHPTVVDIHETVKRRDPSVSLATVYKTLQVFVEIGLAGELGFRESTRYDPDIGDHVHLVCSNCGKIEDLSVDDLGSILVHIKSKIGFKANRMRIDVYGFCENCGQEERSSQKMLTS